MKDAGQKALSDPKVQAMIVQQFKENFPKYAEQASAQVQAWAADPEVQAKAKQYAGMAGAMAVEYAGKAGEQFISLIEQGPMGIRILAFGGGVASCVNAGLTVAN